MKRSWLFWPTLPAILLLLGGCSAVAGPCKISAEQQTGVRVFHVEGYGFNALNIRNYHALYLGWSRHTLVFEDSTPPDASSPMSHFGLFQQLPNSTPVQVSSVSAGAQCAWEPAFRGFALGLQSRTTSYLPLNRDLVLENIPSTSAADIPHFSLHSFP